MVLNKKGISCFLSVAALALSSCETQSSFTGANSARLEGTATQLDAGAYPAPASSSTPRPTWMPTSAPSGGNYPEASPSVIPVSSGLGGYPVPSPSSTSVSSSGSGTYPTPNPPSSSGSFSPPGSGVTAGTGGNLPVNFYCSVWGLQDTGNVDVVNSPTLELVVTDPSGNIACDVTSDVRTQVLAKSIHLNQDCPNLTGNKYNVMLVSSASKSADLFFAGDGMPLQSLAISRTSSGSPWSVTGNAPSANSPSSAASSLPFGIYVMYDTNMSFDSVCDQPGNIADPLVIDVKSDMAPNADLTLTSPANGVLFDILGANSYPVPDAKVQISWIENPAEYMFLALPDSNGQVLGVNQLFGNTTLGPDGKFAANGYAALAKYDLNRDGVIDAKDSVFEKLRLWSDSNHDGIAQPNELLSLDSVGITQIYLKYNRHFKETDPYGNQFRYPAQVIQKGEARISFDVWFKLPSF